MIRVDAQISLGSDFFIFLKRQRLPLDIKGQEAHMGILLVLSHPV